MKHRHRSRTTLTRYVVVIVVLESGRLGSCLPFDGGGMTFTVSLSAGTKIASVHCDELAATEVVARTYTDTHDDASRHGCTRHGRLEVGGSGRTAREPRARAEPQTHSRQAQIVRRRSWATLLFTFDGTMAHAGGCA